MAKITKEQYEKEQSAIKKLVSKEDLALRKRVLEKIKGISRKMERKPVIAKKKIFGVHKNLIKVEQRLWKMLAPRKIKKKVGKKVRKVSRKKSKKTKKSKKRRKK